MSSCTWTRRVESNRIAHRPLRMTSDSKLLVPQCQNIVKPSKGLKQMTSSDFQVFSMTIQHRYLTNVMQLSRQRRLLGPPTLGYNLSRLAFAVCHLRLLELGLRSQSSDPTSDQGQAPKMFRRICKMITARTARNQPTPLGRLKIILASSGSRSKILRS